MNRRGSTNIFLFEGFRFDHRHGGLFRVNEAGLDQPVAIGSRAMDLLSLLLDRSGEPVSKADIMDTVWRGVAVEEGNLTVQISSLRRILDKYRLQGSCIQTLAKQGYRFIIPVTRIAVGTPPDVAPTESVTNFAMPWARPPVTRPSQRTRIMSGTVAQAPALVVRMDRPSIAFLPFAVMGDNIDQETISNGIAEDINTALSRYPSLFVRPRSSSCPSDSLAFDTIRAAREQHARYVVEGSVRGADKRIRATFRLVDAATGNLVWCERYDRELTDFFAAQDEITEAVSIAVASRIGQAEQQRAMRKPRQRFTAWDAYQRGLWHRTRMTVKDTTRAEQFFQTAIELDPTFVGGYRGLALAQLDAATQFQRHNLEEARASSEALAGQAIALDRMDAEARSALAAVLLLGQGDHDGARIEAERALAITPNLASAHGVLGAVLTYSGRPKEALASIATSIRLDPNHPQTAVRLQQVTASLYFHGDHEAAVEAARSAIRSYPNHPQVYRWLAAALVRLGRLAEAKAALVKAIAVAPASFDMYVRNRVAWMRPRDHADMVDDLVKAGWQHN